MKKDIIMKEDIVMSDGILYVAKGEVVSEKRLEWLLEKKIITLDEYIDYMSTALDVESLKCLISSPVNSVIPFATESTKKMVANRLFSTMSEGDISDLTRRLRAKSKSVSDHSIRVAALSLVISDYMGFSDLEMDVVAKGALLHDIGKIFSIYLVEKQDELSSEEIDVLREHTSSGYRFLKGMGFPDAASKIAQLHHERRDGKGYWKMTSIPRTAEVVAVANTVDSIVANTTPSSKADAAEAILELIKPRKDTIYDDNMIYIAKAVSVNRD